MKQSDAESRELTAVELEVVAGGRGCIYNPLTDGPFAKWVLEPNDWLPGGAARTIVYV